MTNPKTITASIDEIVEAVFKELPMGGLPYRLDDIESALRTALEGLVMGNPHSYIIALLDKMISEENEALGKVDFFNQYTRETHANNKYCLAIVKRLIERLTTPTEKGNEFAVPFKPLIAEPHHLPTGNFYCKEWNNVGYMCPEGQCDACKKHEKGGSDE